MSVMSAKCSTSEGAVCPVLKHPQAHPFVQIEERMQEILGGYIDASKRMAVTQNPANCLSLCWIFFECAIGHCRKLKNP